MNLVDLDHNRRGLLGPGQRKTLEEYATLMHRASWGLGMAADEAQRLSAAAKNDLAEGRVVAFDGDVVFDPRKILEAMGPERVVEGKGHALLPACLTAYVGCVPGHAPRQFMTGRGVWPGPYRLYVAPRTNFVAGVEARTMSREYAQRMYHVLLATQRLTEATLAENRRGRMTEAQRQALAAAPKSHVATSMAILALCTGAGAYAVISNALAKGKSVWRFEAVTLVLFTVVFLALLPWMIVLQRKMGAGTKADAAEGRLELRQGVIRKSHSLVRLTVHFTLYMDKEEFDVSQSPELFAAVIEGHMYRAWVAPRSGRLVALEIVEQTDTR